MKLLIFRYVKEVQLLKYWLIITLFAYHVPLAQKNECQLDPTYLSVCLSVWIPDNGKKDIDNTFKYN